MRQYPIQAVWHSDRKYAKESSDHRYLAACLAIEEIETYPQPYRPLGQIGQDKARADLGRFHLFLSRLMTLWCLTLRQSVPVILYTTGLRPRINAENLYKSHQKKNILKEAIPRAWHKIINEPDDLFVELLIETTEKLSGFRPDITDIEKFLQSTPEPVIPKPGPSPARKRTESVTTPRRKTAGDPNDFINKKVRSFTFFNETHNPCPWKELLVTVAEEMYKRDAKNFDRCLSLRGTKMVYFSLDANGLSQPVQIMDSKYFVETKLNSNSIVKRSRGLMSLFGYKDSDLKVVAD